VYLIKSTQVRTHEFSLSTAANNEVKNTEQILDIQRFIQRSIWQQSSDAFANLNRARMGKQQDLDHIASVRIFRLLTWKRIDLGKRIVNVFV
jgi:hypothetical protein